MVKGVMKGDKRINEGNEGWKGLMTLVENEWWKKGLNDFGWKWDECKRD